MLKKRTISFFIVLMVFALLKVYPPVLAQETYHDPVGRFTDTVPAGWVDKSTAGYGLFISNNGISVYLMAVDANDVQAGIEAAIKSIDATFSAVPAASSEIPLPNGTWTQNVYSFPNGSLQIAIAQLKGGIDYIVYIKVPNSVALQALYNDVNSFLLNFTIGSPVDLSHQQPLKLTDASFAQVTSYVEDAMQRYHTVGAAVAVVRDGKIVFSQGFGTLEKGSTTPVNAQTLFMIGSTSKSMTTLMTATLVDDNVLMWDTPVTHILPDFTLSDRAATVKVRVRDLFNMSSGLPRYDIPFYLRALTSQTVEQEIATVPLATQPGVAYHYSNLMDALGGYADAVAAGASLSNAYDTYRQLMQQRVFDPIGMTGTTVDFDAALANANHALPYTYNPLSGRFIPEPINFEHFVTGIAPADAAWSNADDMANYMITELNRGVAPGGRRIVSEQNLLETWKPEIDMGGGSQYGMGWMIGSYKGQRLIQHGGNTSGFSSDFAFLPDANLGVLVLSNRVLNNNFGAAIREYVFETAFGLDHSANAYYSDTEQNLIMLFDQFIKQSGVQDQPVAPTSVANDVGTYQYGVQVGFKGSQFTLTTAYADAPLLPTSGSGHFVTGGAMPGYDVAFGDDGHGHVTMVVSSLLSPITGDTSTYTLQKID